MAYTIERPSPCRVVVNGTIAPAQVQEERAHILAAVMRKAVVPGFRRGKAPRAMVERRYADDIRQEIEEHVLRHTWQEVRESEKLRPATPFGVREVTWKDDGSLELSGEFEVYPEVELPTLDGFVPPPFDLAPATEEIDRALEALRDRQATWEPLETAAAEDGMLVEAEVWGSFPGGEREPFHDERSLFVLGGGEVFPELEAAVRGHTPGEEVSAEREVHEGEGESHRHVVVSYRVAIKSVRRKRLPELDDDLATSLGLEGGLAALRERVEADLRLQKLRARHEQWREALLVHLAQGRVLDLPETPVDEDTRKEVLDFAHSLAQRGIDPEKAALDWDKVREEMRARVGTRMRAELLLDALAAAQGLTVSDAEVNREVQRQAARMGVPFAELRGNLSKSGGLGRVAAIMRREKAVEQALRPFGEPEGA
ncbi:MAG: trigger factor [Thermoanaerobaculaceae bacterium]